MVESQTESDTLDGEARADELVVDRVESGDKSLDIDTDRTLLSILLDHTFDYSDEVAMRWKRNGIWREYTWGEYYEKVRTVTFGLQELGFSTDDILFTIGYNRPQQTWSWLGAMALGGIAAPNYVDDHPEDIRKQIDLLEPKVAYADDQRAVDKLLEVHEQAPHLETIIHRSTKGLGQYDPDGIDLHSFDDVQEYGRQRIEDDDASTDFEDVVGSLTASDIAILPPTSGTTGMPKRVKLSHSNYINMARAALEEDPLPRGTDYVSFLPMAWIGEQMVQMAIAFLAGWITNFPEEPETEMGDIREIGPEMIISSPNTYTQWVAEIKANIENTTRLKRWVYEKTMAIGNRYAEYIIGDRREQDVPAWLRGAHWLSYWIMYRPILDKIGLKRGKNVYTGGAPLGEDHFKFFHALGVPLKQLWGQSEVCGFVTIHDDEDIRIDTVGEVLPNVDVGIRPNGELLVRGPSVTEGYYRQPEKTESAFTEGWLHTDDFGDITDDGHVKVYDRMDDVMELAGGTSVAPIRIETKLKFNPYVKEAVVVGDGREHLSAILNIRYENVAEWADQRDIQYTGYRDLAAQPEVQELISDFVDDVNDELDDAFEIRRFVVLFKELDPDDGELTRTGKVRREIITERYEELIESMYEGRDTVETEITITYQDGQQVDKSGRMRICTLGGEKIEDGGT